MSKIGPPVVVFGDPFSQLHYVGPFSLCWGPISLCWSTWWKTVRKQLEIHYVGQHNHHVCVKNHYVGAKNIIMLVSKIIMLVSKIIMLVSENHYVGQHDGQHDANLIQHKINLMPNSCLSNRRKIKSSNSSETVLKCHFYATRGRPQGPKLAAWLFSFKLIKLMIFFCQVGQEPENSLEYSIVLSSWSSWLLKHVIFNYITACAIKLGPSRPPSKANMYKHLLTTRASTWKNRPHQKFKPNPVLIKPDPIIIFMHTCSPTWWPTWWPTWYQLDPKIILGIPKIWWKWCPKTDGPKQHHTKNHKSLPGTSQC